MSKQFSATFGVNPDYFHENENKADLDMVASIWDNAAEEVFKETGIYVSVVLNESRTVYRKEWGCPDKGEHTVTISGAYNRSSRISGPDFGAIAWESAAASVVMKVKVLLKQKTVLLTFSAADSTYYKD